MGCLCKGAVFLSSVVKKENINIQQNIPLPEEKTGRKLKYPFAEMNIGDSFFSKTTSSRLSTVAGRYGKAQTPERVFTVRKEENGARVWRIK